MKNIIKLVIVILLCTVTLSSINCTEILASSNNVKKINYNEDKVNKKIKEDKKEISTQKVTSVLDEKEAVKLLKSKFKGEDSRVIYELVEVQKNSTGMIIAYRFRRFTENEFNTATLGWYRVDAKTGEIYDEVFQERIP